MWSDSHSSDCSGLARVLAVSRELYDFATSLAWKSWLKRIIYQNLEVVHRIGARLLALTTVLGSLLTDINTSLELSTHFKDKLPFISESAIFRGQVAAPASHILMILVGTALMTADNVAEKVN